MAVVNVTSWNGGFVSFHDTVVNPPEVLRTELLVVNGISYI